MIKIRKATEKDLEWANDIYRSINFPQASLNNEKLAIAKIEDKKIGMGKLKPITKNIFEIAGVYIDDSYRYQGYADSIIQHLLKEIKPGQEVYSIVPDKTSPLYKKAGFKQLGSGQYPKIIKDIRDKRETSYPSYGKFLILKWTQED